ncbi:ABC transporter substrate-binding protein [Xanthobacteraceae bacterium Astr-EGSB]|uniref:ABC transporter substrate-binding protein n=1 Tax=Astrobacterium formosum TaxID=3069710 RepID=UPI0027AE11C8|nr:ABC transporter substrate-binding protein [Xanthobacteraceae bacterium Astr-EGSB]
MNITRRSFHYATLASLAAITAPQLGRSAAAQTPKAGGTLRYGTVTEVTSLDPHVYNGSAWKVLIEALYSPLVGYAADGTITPRLAERWEQPNARTIIFHLRQGVKFHDGTPLTADDVKFSLERIIDPKTAAALRTNLIGATVEVIDATTVKVSQPQPDATLLAILALPEGAIVSRKWIEGGANAKTAANGTGPFRLDVYEPAVRAVLKKNPAYFVPGQPRLDTVEVRMIKSDDARVNALRSGALDMIDFVPWKDIDVLSRMPNFKVDSSGGAFMNVWFNTAHKPFDDPRVRRAFAYAVDRAAIAKAAFFGHGAPIFGPPTPSDSPFYVPDLAQYFKHDPARARSLLAEAGLAKGLDFELIVYQGLGIYTTTAQVIQANLKEIGVNATIKLVEWANLMERKNSGSYDAMLYGVSMKVPDPDAYAYYFGAESTYWAKPIGNRDEVLEKLLADGRATTVTAERKAIYRKVEERLLETSPWVFVNFREQAQAYRRNVKGYQHLGGALNESSAGISLPAMWID